MIRKTQNHATTFSLRAVWLLAATLTFSGVLSAQSVDAPLIDGAAVDPTNKTPAPENPNPPETNGLTLDVYNVKQTAEVGGRISDFAGSDAMWGTLVNLYSGPRLLDYSLSLHADHHNGLLFDDLNFSNFGYGGDPDNVSRLRFSKGKWYDFDSSFRRNQNFFDYDLLANPLNPPTSAVNVPIETSPHSEYLTHRMTDLNLRVLPVSIVRFRLGYSRDVENGTAFDSIHEGTEALLNEPTQWTTDNYRFGVSVKVMPRTLLSYDQFFTHTRGDSYEQLNSVPYTLAGGTPVDLGLSFATAAGQPCATPILPTGFVNPTCNAFLGYSRYGASHLHQPTEQATVQSNELSWLDVSGRFTYSKGQNTIPGFDETFNGLITRTAQRSFTTTGNTSAERLSANGDIGATIHITNKLRLVDSFVYQNFRIPGGYALTTTSLFAPTLLTTPNTFSPATCPPPYTAATCPQHSAASSPDISLDTFSNFLRQERRQNTFTAEYDFTSKIRGYVGYRYENRDITWDTNDVTVNTIYPNNAIARGCPTAAGCTLTVPTASADFTPISTNGAIAGVAARITEKLRFNFNLQIDSADNGFTRISPRLLQTYRITADYKPLDWVSITGVVSLEANSNTTSGVDNQQHYRTYGATVQLAPHGQRYGVDATYDYTDIYSQTNICYVATPAPLGAAELSCATSFLQGNSLYSTLSNYGSGSVFFRPVLRTTIWLGYAMTSADGQTFLINPLAPTGPLTYRYQLPFAAFNLNLTKNVAFKSSWNYYNYQESSEPGPTLPRNVRGNVTTLSLRYEF